VAPVASARPTQPIAGAAASLEAARAPLAGAPPRHGPRRPVRSYMDGPGVAPVPSARPQAHEPPSNGGSAPLPVAASPQPGVGRANQPLISGQSVGPFAAAVKPDARRDLRTAEQRALARPARSVPRTTAGGDGGRGHLAGATAALVLATDGERRSHRGAGRRIHRANHFGNGPSPAATLVAEGRDCTC
jgi:hypothetical protein